MVVWDSKAVNAAKLLYKQLSSVEHHKEQLFVPGITTKAASGQQEVCIVQDVVMKYYLAYMLTNNIRGIQMNFKSLLWSVKSWLSEPF